MGTFVIYKQLKSITPWVLLLAVRRQIKNIQGEADSFEHYKREFVTLLKQGKQGKNLHELEDKEKEIIQKLGEDMQKFLKNVNLAEDHLFTTINAYKKTLLKLLKEYPDEHEQFKTAMEHVVEEEEDKSETERHELNTLIRDIKIGDKTPLLHTLWSMIKISKTTKVEKYMILKTIDGMVEHVKRAETTHSNLQHLPKDPPIQKIMENVKEFISHIHPVLDHTHELVMATCLILVQFLKEFDDQSIVVKQVVKGMKRLGRKQEKKRYALLIRQLEGFVNDFQKMLKSQRAAVNGLLKHLKKAAK